MHTALALVSWALLAAEPQGKSFPDRFAALLSDFPDVGTLDVVSATAPTAQFSSACRLVVVRQRGRAQVLCNLASDAGQRWCGRPNKEHLEAFESYTHPCAVLTGEMKEKPIAEVPADGLAILPKLEPLLDEVTSVRVTWREAGTGLRAVELQGWRGDHPFHSLLIHDGSAWLASANLPFDDEVAAHPFLDAKAMYAAPSWGLVFVAIEAGNGNNAIGENRYSLAFFSKREDGLALVARRPLGVDSWWRQVTDDGMTMGGSSAVLCPGVNGARLDLWLACQRYADPRSYILGKPESFGERCGNSKRGRCGPYPPSLPSDPVVKRRVGSYAARGDTFIPWAAREKVRSLADLQAAIIKEHDEAQRVEDETGRRVRRAPKLVVSERPYELEQDATVEWLEIQNLTKAPVDLASLVLKDMSGHSATVAGICVVPPGDVVVLRRGEGPSSSAGAIECFYGNAELQGPVQLLADDVAVDQSWATHPDATKHSWQRDAKGKECLRPENPGQVKETCD